MTLSDLQTIQKIAKRAVRFYERHDMLSGNPKFAVLGIADELLTVHRDIVPLRLDEMLKSPDLDFMHDIAGIHHHLAHGTPKRPAQFNDCFMPRFAYVERQPIYRK